MEFWVKEVSIQVPFPPECHQLLLISLGFGTVFLARERTTGKDFAIKVEQHMTLLTAKKNGYEGPPMAAFTDCCNVTRYIPFEALCLFLLTHSDRFPTLDSVYTHGSYQAVVMSPVVDFSNDRVLLSKNDYTRKFPPFTGKFLMTTEGRPLLDEMGACKVAYQLLEGIFHMAQLNMWHTDMSVNNFVIDENLDVQIIDLGIVAFGLTDEDYQQDSFVYVPFMEYELTPEETRELLRPEYMNYNGAHALYIPCYNDLRRKVLWNFGVLVYGILHGFWPWDQPPPRGHDERLQYIHLGHPRIQRRRHRMLTEDIFINEDLSEECKEVLRHLLCRDPLQRPNLERLVQFPWFHMWQTQNRIYQRPFSLEFLNSYTQLVRGYY